MRPAVHALLPFATAAAFAAASPAPASAQSPPAPYRLEWLGQDFYPHAVNDRGQVVGYTFPRDVDMTALLWQNGNVSSLGDGQAQDINNLGQIVISRPEGGEPVIVQPDGTRTILNVPDRWGADFRHQYSINDRGQVVGMVRVSASNSDGRAFFWDSGKTTFINLDLPQAPAYSSAHGLNNIGQAVGWWGTHTSTGGGFLWQHGALTRLPGPAVSINNSGQVLTLGAEVWEAGETTPLGRIALLPATDEEMGVPLEAREINDAGQVVGWQRELYLIDVESGYGSVDRGVLWDATGAVVDLNALMGFAQGQSNQFPLSNPLDVNNGGQIVGYGPQGGWLLTPVPEPAGAGAMLVGCAALAGTGRRGRARLARTT